MEIRDSAKFKTSGTPNTRLRATEIGDRGDNKLGGRMEPRGKAVTGRRQFLCGCCATLASVGLGASFAAAATDPVVVPVESAPFHLEAFENEYVRFLNVLIPPGKVGVYHRHSIDFAQVIIEATDRLEITVLDKPMGLVSLKTGQVVFGGYSKAPLIHQVANAGQGSLHVKGIEIFNSQPGRFSPSTRTDVPAYTSVLDNERVRGWRLVLQPGESRRRYHADRAWGTNGGAGWRYCGNRTGRTRP